MLVKRVIIGDYLLIVTQKIGVVLQRKVIVGQWVFNPTNKNVHTH